jgi:uncharacterized protein (DUF427 family)
MPKAIWNDKVIADARADDVRVVEGNVYFPHEAVKQEYLQPSSKTTQCPWKGTANYFNVVVDGKRNEDAAWTYRTPKEAAQEVAGRVSFWRGVTVEQ